MTYSDDYYGQNYIDETEMIFSVVFYSKLPSDIRITMSSLGAFLLLALEA